VAALIVWSSWLTLMTGANLATPLYAVYAERFGFSSLVLTAVFATYAFVLVPSLILFGRLSDRFGRRPVLFAGLLTASVGLGLFAAAQSVSWLFGARAVQGLAVGMISGAATAALVELDPDGDRRRAALLAGLAQAGGSALGPLFAGVLAEWAPYPRHLDWRLRPDPVADGRRHDRRSCTDGGCGVCDRVAVAPTNAPDAGFAGVGTRRLEERATRSKSSWRAQRAGFRTVVARAGIEPATPRFSAVCSTN
jgi:MFS transporter